MASKKRLMGAALAESRVLKKQLQDSPVPTYSLAVNPGFAEPNSVDKMRGVEYPGASENIQAEQGISRRVIKVMQPDNLGAWVRGQVARRGGTRQLAEALTRMVHDPKHANTEVRNLQRKLQEYQQGGGKYRSLGKLNATRVAILRLSQAKHLVIGVRGLWEIEEKEFFRVFNSDPRETAQVQAALDALRLDGAGFISTVIDIANELTQPYGAVLLRTHELRVEVNV